MLDGFIYCVPPELRWFRHHIIDREVTPMVARENETPPHAPTWKVCETELPAVMCTCRRYLIEVERQPKPPVGDKWK